jgi:hypothetical protein
VGRGNEKGLRRGRMRAVVFTDRELDLEGLGIGEVYLIFAKGVKGGITVSEISESVGLAQSKMPLLRRAEEIIEKLEKKYDVLGMSVVFKDYEDEIESVLEAYKPDILVAGRYMPITRKMLEHECAMLFHRERFGLERVLYVHCPGGNLERARNWIKIGKEITVLGIVEPMLPPETYAKKMKECQEMIQKEIEHISKDLAVKKIVTVGGVVEEVKKFAAKLDPSVLILSRNIGVEKVREILEKTEKSVLVV